MVLRTPYSMLCAVPPSQTCPTPWVSFVSLRAQSYVFTRSVLGPWSLQRLYSVLRTVPAHFDRPQVRTSARPHIPLFILITRSSVAAGPALSCLASFCLNMPLPVAPSCAGRRQLDPPSRLQKAKVQAFLRSFRFPQGPTAKPRHHAVALGLFALLSGSTVLYSTEYGVRSTFYSVWHEQEC
jgi:hypothetical protein